MNYAMGLLIKPSSFIFTLMPHFFPEVICSIKCTHTKCSLNAISMMVGFFSSFFDLDLPINEFWHFFDIGYIDGVGLLRTCHRLFDLLSKLDHDCAKDTLEISREWESDSSLSYMFKLLSLMIQNLAQL